jgi:hypothetical protein
VGSTGEERRRQPSKAPAPQSPETEVESRMKVGDRVRLRVALRVAHEPARAGVEGYVFGCYRRNGRAEVVVALDGLSVIVDEEDLELVSEQELAPPS